MFSFLLHLEPTEVGNCTTDTIKNNMGVSCYIDDLTPYWPGGVIPSSVEGCEGRGSKGKISPYSLMLLVDKMYVHFE